MKSGINTQELAKHVAPRNIFQPSLSCTKFVVCHAVCNTQMEIKWSWNNKKHDEHLFDDRITNHWFNYTEQFSSSKCLRHNLLLFAKFIDCGILLYCRTIETQIQMIFWYVILYLCVWFLLRASSIWGGKSGSSGKKAAKRLRFRGAEWKVYFLLQLSQSATTPVLVNINNICLIPSNIYHGCLPRK